MQTHKRKLRANKSRRKHRRGNQKHLVNYTRFFGKSGRMKSLNGGHVPSFHVMIVSGGRPELQIMLDSLKQELQPHDAITVVFDGKNAKNKSQYTDDWVKGINCSFHIKEQIPGLKHYGHLSLNKYLHDIHPKTTYVMFADDDDVYKPESFNYLRQTCVDPDILYIAQMEDPEGKLIPPTGTTNIKLNEISKQCGIIPFDKRTLSKMGERRNGDFNYYNNIKDKVKDIVYLNKVIYARAETPNINGNL
jgi:hypothetical protein